MSSSDRSVTIETGSRLHFGLIDPVGSSGRLYAGAGVMVDAPGIRMTARLAEGADRITATQGMEKRLGEFIRRYREATGSRAHFDIGLAACPADHLGLGTGTQLGMAVSSACSSLLGLEGNIETIAGYTGRGRRSSIGVHGFENGGFLVDDGKLEEAGLSPLRHRIELPEAWHFVLVIAPGHRGLSGRQEAECFTKLEPVAEQTVARLEALLEEALVPAGRKGDWPVFSRALHEFGLIAGQPFQEAQGGAFSTTLAAQAAEYLLEAGVEGVGQSSWGPTLYALLPGRQEAETAAGELRKRFGVGREEVVITRPCSRGASVKVVN